MEQHTHKPAYDHISISNRARELRAEVTAAAARKFGAWVARNWAEMTRRKGHQPA